MLAMEFLARGAAEFGEPGVFLAFEESKEDLVQNFRSIGLDLEALVAEKKLFIDYLRLDQHEIHEAGDFDLEGLFFRLGLAVDAVGAKRVAIDTIEILFSSFENHAVIRAELQRLFRWLKNRNLSAVVTGERGENTITRYGLEEYVADCVILLDTRVQHEFTTRRLRIVKYRGSIHALDEFPFLIDTDGFSVLPITSAALEQAASDERVSTGIPRLDVMLGGEGVFRGRLGPGLGDRWHG